MASTSLTPFSNMQTLVPPAPPAEWEDITGTGTLLETLNEFDDPAFDDAKGLITLAGFDFPFYGTNYTDFYPTTNGLVIIDPVTDFWENMRGPVIPLGTDKWFGVFGTDLICGEPRTGSVDPGIWYQEFADHLVIQWNDAMFWSDPFSAPFDDNDSHLFFQAVFWDDGSIQYIYGTMDPLTVDMPDDYPTLQACVGFQSNDTTDFEVVSEQEGGVWDAAFEPAVIIPNSIIEFPPT